LSAWQEIIEERGWQIGKEKEMHAHGSFLRVFAKGKVGRGSCNETQISNKERML
jgi:hypothetical protein